jgi:CRISPR-associated endoribonuclease Cas6
MESALPQVRLRLQLHAEGVLPLTYREGLQAALYQALPPSLSAELHDRGLADSARPLKLFVFSRLLGLSYLPEEKAFAVRGSLVLYFASAFQHLLDALTQGIWEQGGLRVGGLFLQLNGVSLEPCSISERTVVEALAPITVYQSTEGQTHYYNPYNREFALLLEANLNRKARALGLEEGHLKVHPLGLQPKHKRLERYKGTWVEGWMGRYRLEGSSHLQKLALLTGLGAKNSQGLGFVREV